MHNNWISTIEISTIESQICEDLNNSYVNNEMQAINITIYFISYLVSIPVPNFHWSFHLISGYATMVKPKIFYIYKLFSISITTMISSKHHHLSPGQWNKNSTWPLLFHPCPTPYFHTVAVILLLFKFKIQHVPLISKGLE